MNDVTEQDIQIQQPIPVNQLVNVPQSGLTAADNTALTVGGAFNLTNTDSAVIANMRARINELETKLKKIGLIK